MLVYERPFRIPVGNGGVSGHIHLPLSGSSRVRQGDVTRQEPLRYRVSDDIRRMIVSGLLLPGQQLHEEELARELQVSRGSVRDAVQLLEFSGWVEIRPRAGAFVHEPTTREADEVFELRAALDEHCARKAARTATADDLSGLKEALAAADRELAAPTTHRRSAARESVHTCIRSIAGNARISRLARELDQLTAWCFVPLVRSRRDAARHEHRAIVDAITAGDADLAGRLARDHCLEMHQSFREWH